MTKQYQINFKEAGKNFMESIPLGNGRLGAMIPGQVSGHFFKHEEILINEDSCYYRNSVNNRNNPDCKENYLKVRKLLLEGKQTEAEYLAQMSMRSAPKQVSVYQPLATLNFCYANRAPHSLSGHSEYDPHIENYQRSLTMNTGIATVKYKMKGSEFRHEYFTSLSHQVLVIRLECDQPESISLNTWLTRRPFQGESHGLGKDSILLKGSCGPNGTDYACVVKAFNEGGTVKIVGDHLQVDKANAITLVLAANTDFRHEHPQMACEDQIAQSSISYQNLKKEHEELHRQQFERVQLKIDHEDHDEHSKDHKNISERVAGEYSNSSDSMSELIFHFGRYLMMASSQPGSLPSNLQGIWCKSFTPPWESAYTININTQMNYWLAEPLNLSECHDPLFDLVERLCENGKKTAQELYGCKGSVVHHNTDPWADTSITGLGCDNNIWPMSGPWFSLHFWDRYQHTGDLNILERAFPLMKCFADFYMDYLHQDTDGLLLTGPSVSPENRFYLSDNKNEGFGTLCMGPTMDSQILREFFSTLIQVCKILGHESNEYSSLITKLPKTQVSPLSGKIMEWREEKEEPEPGHRHISHLFGLYPGTQISPTKTPELSIAAQKTLDDRLNHGGGQTGWSAAWTTLFYARLHQPSQAFMTLSGFYKDLCAPNLLDMESKDLFQIDGNLGCTMGIYEMLIQSHDGYIHLLPALPQEWKNGHLSGVIARGGFEIEMSWKSQKINNLTIKSLLGNPLRLKAFDGEIHYNFSTEKGNLYHFNNGQLDLLNTLNNPNL